MAYKNPKMYDLTPSHKNIGKAVAKRSRQSVARECFKKPTTRKHLLKHIGMVIRNELKAMCSDKVGSLLRADLHSRHLHGKAPGRIVQECSCFYKSVICCNPYTTQ